MSAHVKTAPWVTTVALLAIAVASAHGDEPKKEPPLSTAHQTRKAAERGLDFVVKDAIKWRTDKTCATCHHGTMTVWALAEAKSQGFTIAAETTYFGSAWGTLGLMRSVGR